jgi:hypothetical protein
MEKESRKKWNRCDYCGRFISYDDLFRGKAIRRIDTEDTEFSSENYITLCEIHNPFEHVRKVRNAKIQARLRLRNRPS